MDKHTPPKYLLSLTEREQEVLELIAAGLSNNAIAEQLFLSHHTVTWYVKQIFNKLGVSRRTQAVAVARLLGLLDEPTSGGNSPKSASRYRIRHNLPPQPTSFIGREDEIAEIAVLLDDASYRLLTLVGPGGSGKTRLAIEVAARKLDEFANGIFFIALQPLTSHEEIVPTIASSLGVQLRPDGHNPQQQLFDYFRNKSVLLLIDNFEHLLAGAKILPGLLSAASGVRVLATSRESLNLREEHLYNVGGLQFPDHDRITSTEAFSAVELFAERARRIYPDFSLTDELPDVVRICQLVGGMPLALELAASWLKTLCCAEIAAEIQRGLDILATPLRNVPERHRSMQAVFDYSWQLLSEKERATFRRLSVFRGGCTHEAARQVAGADLRVLQALADKSFIHREPHTGRYDIHELLRQYGEWHLEQSAEDCLAVYNLHCEYYADLLGKHRDDVSNHRQRNMMQELELELDNIRAAWRWAIDHRKVDEIQKALHTFFFFHIFRSRFLEAAYALEAAIHRLDSGELGGQWGGVLATLLSYCGWIFGSRLGRYEQAKISFHQSLELYQKLDAPAPPGWGSEPHAGLTLLASIQGDYVEAEEFGEQARVISEANGDKWNLQLALYGLTSACFHQGKYQEARQYTEQAYTISIDSGDLWFRAIILNDLGRIARVTEDYGQAREHYRDSLAIRKAFDDPQGMAAALQHLGRIAVLESDYAEARRLYRESLALYSEIGDRGGVGDTLCGLGTTAFASGEYREAGQYFHQALQIAGDIHYAPFTFSLLIGVSELLLHVGKRARGVELLALVGHHDHSDHEAKDRAKLVLADMQDDLKAKLRDGAYNAAWERGKSLDLETVVQELLDEFSTK